MQNSGLGNIINPLLSLADPYVYSIPAILMIGWCGEPGIRDEPQHKKQGKVTLKLLDAMEVPYKVITSEMTDNEVRRYIEVATSVAKKNNTPYALVIKKGTFSNYKLKKVVPSNFPLRREDAIKIIVNNINGDDIVVSTTGVASRELFEYREALGQSHENDFLTVGGMGHANQIALGIALNKPDREVYCFDGDGAMLMHMGSVAINGSLQCQNLIHVVFNNGAHDSVGGQPTVGYYINIPAIAKAVGYSTVMKAETETDIANSIQKLKATVGLSLLEIKVNKGFRKDLGRPTKTPMENKEDLMRFIS